MSNGDISNAAKQFDISGDFTGAHPYGNGHINDTYLALYDTGGSIECYIIQRINHNVFKKPMALMNNIARVTEHIQQKLQESNVDDISRQVLTLIPTLDGDKYFRDESGNYWRCYNFIDNGRNFDTCENLEHISEAAKEFGRFQHLLSDLPSPPLHETIPDFHNGLKRLKAFKVALKEDKHNRAVSGKKEIDLLLNNSGILEVLPELVKESKIPLRVTHNDTKINNIMFDNETNNALCVIDLDTVMAGLSLYDFGDIVRTTISQAPEDERDLSKVIIDISRFQAIVNGYLSSTRTLLNNFELDNMVIGAKTIILEQTMRFLTDYLSGDTYYKTSRHNQNLDRCRTQVKLFEQIIQQEAELNKIVDKYK